MPRVRAWGLVLLLAAGCRDLPDGQLLTSAHFRYHARAETVIEPGIMDRLEAWRTELDGRFGVDPGVVDYYLYRDQADFEASSSCPGRPCTDGRSVMTAWPLEEHELVHALLHDSGWPSLVVAEGVAQYHACILPRLAYRIPPEDWAIAAGANTSREVDYAVASTYNFGQRLTGWMLATGGARRFIDFYGTSLGTTDAAVFALQFHRFWGRRIADVAADLLDPRFDGSSCPCTAPALPTDGSSIPLVMFQEYRTLEVAEESRLEIESDGPQMVFPYVCANAVEEGALDYSEDDATKPARIVARVGAARHGITAYSKSRGTAHLSAAVRPQSDWSCAAALAHPIPLDERDATAWVTPERSMERTWFAFDFDGIRRLDMLTPTSLYAVCPSCDTPLAECVTPYTSGILAGLEVRAKPGSPLLVSVRSAGEELITSVGVRIRDFH